MSTNGVFHNKTLEYIVTVLVTIIVSMTSFWLFIGREYITIREAQDLVDRSLKDIHTKIDLYYVRSRELEEILSRNADAINALKVQLAILEQALNNLRPR